MNLHHPRWLIGVLSKPSWTHCGFERRLTREGDAIAAARRRFPTTVGRQAAYAYRWTSHLPVVSPEGRVSRRPGKRQALNRAYHFFDLPPKVATRTASNSRWEWLRRHDQY